MNMQRLPNLMARTPEDKPAWVTEIIKAIVLVVLSWAVTAWLSARGDNEHRFTALETKSEIMQTDIKEMKADIKEVLKAVK